MELVEKEGSLNSVREEAKDRRDLAKRVRRETKERLKPSDPELEVQSQFVLSDDPEPADGAMDFPHEDRLEGDQDTLVEGGTSSILKEVSNSKV